MIKPYFKTPIDIAFYFRDKESVSELIQFIVNESYIFSDIIDKNNNQIPYPIIYNSTAFKYQIDYQFFIHCLAKFVTLKTNIRSNYKQIVNDFAILSGNINQQFNDNNRTLLIYIVETLNVIFYAGNYARKLSDILIFSPTLFQYKDLVINFKVLTIPDMNLEKYFKGFEFYYPEWKEKRERFYNFSLDNGIKQLAFLDKNVNSFIKRNEVKPLNYFQFNPFKLLDFVDYNEASILFENGVNN